MASRDLTRASWAQIAEYACQGELAEAVVLEAQDGGLGRFVAEGALVASGWTGHTSEAGELEPARGGPPVPRGAVHL